MKSLLFLVFLVFSYVVLATENSSRNFDFGRVPCDGYENCLKKFGGAILLAANVTAATREVFNKNWRLLLDNKNIQMDEKERLRGRSCSLLSELIPLPPQSPLAKVVQEQFKGLKAISQSARDERFVFESDLQVLRNLAGNKGVYGIMPVGIKSAEDARELFKKQSEWEQKNQEEMKKFSSQNSQDFKKSCLQSNIQEIENIRSRILAEHRELADLESRLEKAQEECQGIYKFHDKVSARYSNNQLSQSRYNRMKEVALTLCAPSDAIENLIGQKNNCSKYVEDVYDVISPECESRGGSEVKGNLCNGLHRHIVKTFVENPKYDEYLKSFVSKMRSSFSQGKKDDLLEMALQSTHGDRVAAVRLIALVGHDESNTSMRSIREELIRTNQFDRLVATDDLYTKEVHVSAAEDKRFAGTQVVEGNMTLFKNLIRNGSTVGQTKLSGRYYHFIAGTVVSCELKAKNYGAFRAKTAASLAGKVYETLDFKSHIETGVGFSESIDNFRKDTAKHTAGGDLGSTFCP